MNNLINTIKDVLSNEEFTYTVIEDDLHVWATNQVNNKMDIFVKRVENNDANVQVRISITADDKIIFTYSFVDSGGEVHSYSDDDMDETLEDVYDDLRERILFFDGLGELEAEHANGLVSLYGEARIPKEEQTEE